MLHLASARYWLKFVHAAWSRHAGEVRASWVVETAMECRASLHGVIPTPLLQSISRNLFLRNERNRDEELHPADYPDSALLDNAAHARVKLGDTELEYNRRALKKRSTPGNKKYLTRRGTV
jgi:hypothetical protein